MPRQIALAEKTGPTRPRKRNAHAIASADLSHIASDIFDHPHEFVTEYQIFDLRKKAVVDVEVGTTDRTGGYSQNDVLCMLKLRIGHVIYFNVLRPMKNQCLHRLPAASVSISCGSRLRSSGSTSSYNFSCIFACAVSGRKRRENTSALFAAPGTTIRSPSINPL